MEIEQAQSWSSVRRRSMAWATPAASSSCSKAPATPICKPSKRRPPISPPREAQQPGFIGLFSSFRASTPQLFVDVDRVKCKTMKVDLNDVFDTLQAFLGSYYVNDFNRFGRTWQVNVQADAPYRINADTVKQFRVRNASGDMVPLGALATIRDDVGPVFVLALQHADGDGDQRGGDAQRQLRIGDRNDGAAVQARNCRATWTSSGAN